MMDFVVGIVARFRELQQSVWQAGSGEDCQGRLYQVLQEGDVIWHHCLGQNIDSFQSKGMWLELIPIIHSHNHGSEFKVGH